jgi:hypothetical protein
MKQTIAQTLGIKEFPFIVRNDNGNVIYMEQENGFWERWEVDLEGRELYYEDSDGFWEKSEWGSKGRQIFYENSDGEIRDNRPKPDPTTIEINGKKYKLIEI